MEPPYFAIRKLISEGRVIPFLGAGASIGPTGEGEQTPWSPDIPLLPSGRELANYFADSSSFPSSDLHDRNDLAKVASFYSDVVGSIRLHQEIHQILDRDYPVRDVHKFLAEVEAHQVIVVTNYDTLLEQAFRAAQKPYDLVVYSTRDKEHANSLLWWPHGGDPQFKPANEFDIDLSTTTVIYKMHGTFVKDGGEKESFVITEEDYIEFLSRMTTQNAIPTCFTRFFSDRNFLFLGYSLSDWNFRVILKNIAKLRNSPENFLGNPGLPAWAIQKNPSELEQELWQKRGVSIYNMTVDDFIKKLSQRGRA